MTRIKELYDTDVFLQRHLNSLMCVRGQSHYIRFVETRSGGYNRNRILIYEDTLTFFKNPDIYFYKQGRNYCAAGFHGEWSRHYSFGGYMAMPIYPKEDKSIYLDKIIFDPWRLEVDFAENTRFRIEDILENTCFEQTGAASGEESGRYDLMDLDGWINDSLDLPRMEITQEPKLGIGEFHIWEEWAFAEIESAHDMGIGYYFDSLRGAKAEQMRALMELREREYYKTIELNNKMKKAESIRQSILRGKISKDETEFFKMSHTASQLSKLNT